MLYLISLIIVVALLFLYWLGKTKNKKVNLITSRTHNFQSYEDLKIFISKNLDNSIKDKKLCYGFVENTFLNDEMFQHGLSDNLVLDVDVKLITDKGDFVVEAISANPSAKLLAGDFVLVVPFYNQQLKTWTYVVAAKLGTNYLGNKGFNVLEDYS